MFIRWQFSIKTISEIGLILYNSKKSSTLSRHSGNVDFVGVELVGGKIRVAQNWGSGVTELYSDVTINDGVWHSINVAMEAGGLDVTIDAPKHRYRLALNNSALPSKHLDLSTIVSKIKSNMILFTILSIFYTLHVLVVCWWSGSKYEKWSISFWYAISG